MVVVKNEAKGAQNRLSEVEFVLMAIQTLRKKKYKGIHTVYSGFNDAYRKYFGTDPVEATKRLAAEGKIVLRPARKGATIYDPADAPTERPWSPGDDGALAKILKG